MTSTDIQNLIVSTATAYGVDPRLALEVAIQESGLNPNAVSSAGAVGIFQLMPATSAQLGVTDPTDPTQNIYAGVQYLGSLITQFGDTATALAAYNWGQGNVQNAIAQYGSGWLSEAPSETQNYVASIMAAVGSEYSVSAGTTAAASTGQIFNLPGIPGATVETAGIGTGTNLSFGTIAIIVGLGLVGLMLFSD